MKMKAIKGGRIILPDRIVEGCALLYTDVIEGIVPVDEIPNGAKIFDAAGAFVAPGLIDLHIHGYLGRDVCDSNEESLRTIARGLVKNGIVGFLPTTMTESEKVIVDSLEAIRSVMEESKCWDGSEILGCHAEGPFISASKKGAQDEKHIKKPDAQWVNRYADVIKIITLAPEEDEDFAEIEKMQVVVSMGHTSADYDTAMKSTRHGVSHATHLFNAMTPLTHRAPGVVGAALNSDVSCELIVDTLHVSPALFDMVYKLKGRKLCFITDCLPAGGLEPGEYTLGGQKIIYRDNICRLLDGTIAGSVLKLNQGVRNVYENSSIPLWECFNCASLNPANAIGIGDRKGSLERGKDADIIVCNENFEILKTVIRGETRYEFEG